MTSQDLLHYIEAGAAAAAILVPVVGAIGHALAAMPWVWAKTVGNALNAVSLDVGDLLAAAKNAKASVAAKKEGQS
jgi:hypothetical protein